MKKHIKNAAGVLLMVAALIVVCVVYQEPHEDQVQYILEHWPSFVLVFTLAFGGVALVDTRHSAPPPAPKTYIVGPGDSLWAIAASQLGNGARWPEIQKLNGLNSTTIHAGQILKIPNNREGRP